MNPLTDLPHGEFALIDMTLARLIWSHDRFTGVLFTLLSLTHGILAFAYLLGWRG